MKKKKRYYGFNLNENQYLIAQMFTLFNQLNATLGECGINI